MGAGETGMYLQHFYTVRQHFFTLYGVLVWKNMKKKGVRLMYSFPSKTFSAYGATH